jgi:hypothetical protein
MPVLRMPGDDTLGSTLGSMADAWGQAYDPLARARAAQMGQTIQMSRFELGQKQSIDAMNANAAQVYLNANPLGEDDASLAATAAAIRSGSYNPEQWVNATTGLAKLNANRKAAGALTPGSPDTAGMTPGQIADAQAQVLGGASLPTYQSQVAGATTDIAKTAATLNASNLAGGATPATMPDLARALAAAQAFTSPKEALITAAGGNVAAGANATSPADLAAVRANTTLFAGQPIAAGTPVNQGDVASVRAADTAQKATVAGVEAMTRPRSPQDISSGFVADPNNPNTPVTFVQPGETPPATPPGGVLVPPREPSLPTVKSLAAAEASGKEGGSFVTKARNEDVQEDIESGLTSQMLLRNIGLLRQYAPQLNNDNPISQAASAALNRTFEELGVTLTPGQSARNAFDVISKQLIAASRKDAGVQRMAGPEISYLERALPNAAQDSASLMQGLDNLETKARLGIDIGTLARKTLAGSPDSGVTQQGYTDFLTKRAAINAPPTEAQPFGTATPKTGTQTPAPPLTPKTRVWDSTTNKWIFE